MAAWNAVSKTYTKRLANEKGNLGGFGGGSGSVGGLGGGLGGGGIGMGGLGGEFKGPEVGKEMF